MAENRVEKDINKQPLCCQAGYLPIPLRCVPAEGLAGLEVYLANNGEYSVYSPIELEFGSQDFQRLLENGVEFVYVSVHDHQAYYRTIENAIESVVADSNIQEEKKSEFLYATSIELSNQLLAAPPGEEEVNRAANLSRATVQLIMKDQEAFGRLYEAFNHDFYTATHLVNVCGLTISLAQKMGLVDIHILQWIGTGGLLHDVGKIFLPSEILNTDKSLTAEQYELVKTHVDRGCQHLEKVMDLPAEMLAVVAEHHERMDGSGYPKGLRHDELSPFGRLAGIVDTFDAMTSVRPYRSHTYSMAETLEWLEDEAPEKFDIEIVHAFTSLVENTIQTDRDMDEKTSSPPASVRLSSDDLSGLKHTQYYFRIPIVLRRLRKIRDRWCLDSKEQVIAHKISCIGIGILSDRSFDLNQNIHICAPKLKAVGLGELLAVVTRCRDHTGGWYSVEAQFHQSLTAEVVDQVKTVTTVREISPLTASHT